LRKITSLEKTVEASGVKLTSVRVQTPLPELDGVLVPPTGDSGRNIKNTGQAAQHTLYQVSTATALVEGIYHGAVPVSTLREHGDLEGEMVIVDGHCYQVRSDGAVRPC
jgi:hypothetical protein